MPLQLGSWRTLKSGVLLFWAVWLTVALATDVCDALKAGRVLPPGWTFNSGNWELLLKVTAVHATPVVIVGVMFLGVIAWEAVAGLLFWRAWAAGGRGGLVAFVVGLSLWATLAVAAEIFLAHAVEAVPLRLFGLQLLSVLALRLLPE